MSPVSAAPARLAVHGAAAQAKQQQRSAGAMWQWHFVSPGRMIHAILAAMCCLRNLNRARAQTRPGKTKKYKSQQGDA
jgi:hypothetical protein